LRVVQAQAQIVGLVAVVVAVLSLVEHIPYQQELEFH
jgi:hypothetical protein